MPNPTEPATSARPATESVTIRRVMNGYIVTVQSDDWSRDQNQNETVHATFESALVRIHKDMAPYSKPAAKLSKKHPAKFAA